MIESSFYLKRGVSSGKSNLKKITKDLPPGVLSDTFCNILPDLLTGSPDHGLIVHSDGVGTKAALAYLMWKETGDLSVFNNLAIDALVMNLDDIACTGAVDHFAITNTIGRNRFLIPDDVLKAVLDGYQMFIDRMSDYDINLRLGGGETADVGDLVRTLNIDASITARIRRSDTIDFKSLAGGLAIVGLSSFGTCDWENTYNSGIGSNGLTMARHDSLSSEYRFKYPETFSPETPSTDIYCGNYKLTDPLPETSLNIGTALLSPTRTYLPVIKTILKELRTQIKGIVHCTGGGQTKCMKFGHGIHYVKNDLFPIPPLFSFLSDTKSYNLKDLFPVYNMGHRMEIFTEESHTAAIIDIARSYGVAAKVIGFCKPSVSTTNQLTIEHNGQKIEYQEKGWKGIKNKSF